MILFNNEFNPKIQRNKELNLIIFNFAIKIVTEFTGDIAL